MSAAPTSTTNITGFFATVAGFSFAKDARIARPTISASNNGRDRTSLFGSSAPESSRGIVLFVPEGAVKAGIVLLPLQANSEHLAGVHQIVLHNGTQRQRGKEGQSAYDQHRANQQANEQWAMRW